MGAVPEHAKVYFFFFFLSTGIFLFSFSLSEPVYFCFSCSSFLPRHISNLKLEIALGDGKLHQAEIQVQQALAEAAFVKKVYRLLLMGRLLRVISCLLICCFMPFDWSLLAF
jgi:hypothetical protein